MPRMKLDMDEAVMNNDVPMLASFTPKKRKFKFSNVNEKNKMMNSENKRYSVVKEEIEKENNENDDNDDMYNIPSKPSEENNEDNFHNPFDSVIQSKIKENPNKNILMSRSLKNSAVFINSLKTVNYLIASTNVNNSKSKFSNINFNMSNNYKEVDENDIKFEIYENNEEYKDENQIEYHSSADDHTQIDKNVIIDIDKIPSIDKATFNEITEKRNNSYETSLHLSSIINNTLFSHIDINQFPLLFTSSINDKQFDNAIMEYLSLSPEQSIIDEIDITFYNAFSTIPSLTLFEEINRQYHYNTITEYNHLVENIIPTSLFQDFQYQRKFCIVDLAVIFSLFENAILNKDKVQINTIMLCILRYTSKDNDKVIVAICKIISTHVNNENYDKGYHVFLISLFSNTQFRNVLCKMPKDLIHTFINNPSNRNLVQSLYDSFLNKDYDNSTLTNTIIEDSSIRLFLYSKIFHFNYTFQQRLEQEIAISSNKNTTTFNYHYEFNTFSILYTSSQYSMISNLSSLISYSNDNTILLCNDHSNSQCAKCFQSTDTITINSSNKICKGCLISSLHQCISNRVDYLISTNYSIPSLLFSPIKISNTIYINNKDINFLYNNSYPIFSISFFLRKEILKRNKCIECNKTFMDIFESNKELMVVSLYQCGCLYCKECLNGLISKETKSRYILNHYEIVHDEFKPKCKGCEQQIKDYKVNLNMILSKEDIKKYEREAYERYQKLCNVVCCVCGEVTNDNVIKVNAKIEKHKICSICKKGSEIKEKKGNTILECMLCGVNHQYNSLLVNLNEDMINKKKDSTNKVSSNNGSKSLIANSESIKRKKKEKKKCCLIF